MFVCDLGFSALKWVYGDRRGKIVSAHRRSGGGLVVGEEALLSVAPSYLRTVEDLVHYYPAFVEAGASAGEVPKGTSLTVGLPYGMWASEKDRPEGVVKTLIRSLNAVGWPEVRVLPQGLGGLRLFLAQNPNLGGNVLGIDIGFNTIIFTLLDAGTRSIILGDTFYKKGVFQVAQQLLPTLRDLAPSRSYTPVEISRVIEHGFIQYGLDRHDIRPQIKQAMDGYIEDVLRDIHGELKSHVGMGGNFETVVAFGGGARLLGDTMRSEKVRVVVLPDPEFSNAAGFAL